MLNNPRFIVRHFCLLTFLLVSGCAVAPPLIDPDAHRFAPGPGPYKFECDVRGGYFEELNAAVNARNVRVTGIIQIQEVRMNEDWAPAVGVTFAGPHYHPKAGLQIVVMPELPDVFQLAIKGTGGEQKRSVFFRTPLTTKMMPFTLKISDSGELHVSIADVKASMNVDAFDITRLNLFCSGVRARISEVTVVVERDQAGISK